MQKVARFSLPCVRQFSAQSGGKPPISVVHALKDGRMVTVRRLEPSEEPKLRSFLAIPKQMGDLHANEATRAEVVGEHFFKVQAPGFDSVAALVQDKVVGTADIDPQPEAYERPVDSSFVTAHGLDVSQVCVARMMVNPDDQGVGVGRALKLGLRVAAAQAGYKAVVSETSHPAVKRIVASEGGAVQEGLGSVWTLMPVDAAAGGAPSQDTNSQQGGEPG